LHQGKPNHANPALQNSLIEILTFVKYQSSQEFGYDSELAQVAEVNYPIINVSGLSCITKINHMMNGLEKLLPIMGYINETLFER
jgi:hypothetical protein